jgi:2-methylcitrate dehydratase PrpD
MSTGPLHQLAAFAAATDIRELPVDVVKKTRACLLYAAAVGIAGTGARQPRQAAAAVVEGGGQATCFQDGQRRSSRTAAFANGTLFHARVQDDAHPAGHVGVVVVPAALAVAEAAGSSGADLLAALVAGYETALRIGRDHTSDLSARGFRTTPTYGVFGAAAAASRLSRLDAAHTAHALALAANMAGGLREFSEAGSEDFPFQAGCAAMNGVLAAELAASGATGASTALDGAAGFFRAFGERDRDYAARISDGLGRDFELMAVTYKPYPICQFHRAIVQGSRSLSERAGASELTALAIHMHPFEADFFGVRYKGPFVSFPQTFMSAAFCAALAWTRGVVTLAGLTDFSAQDVLDVVVKVEIIADPARARYAPRLVAPLSDGSTLSWEEREGANSYALTWETAGHMTKALCVEAGVATHAEGLINLVSVLGKDLHVDPLIGLICNACTAARDTLRS